LGGSHGFLTILSAEDPTEAYLSAVTASTWASYNSVYHVGKALYAETRYGTVQTGMLCTSQEGGSARLIDAILRWRVKDSRTMEMEALCPIALHLLFRRPGSWMGTKGRLLDKDYQSSLDERDIIVSGPEDAQVRQDRKEQARKDQKNWRDFLGALLVVRIVSGLISC